MASPLQRASTRRKIYYFAAIAVLFSATILWRGGIIRPLSGTGWFDRQTIQARAIDMEMREVGQGNAELSGSAIRLGLTGSRGLVTSVLWMAAIEKQKKHEWNDLEILVNTITKLQPHFLTPWLFQSWNLTYNVSVEADRLNDVFFYISRGIMLLARGDSINRNNPDMRWSIGFYYQNKFGVHDKVDTMRALYSMSCIPPGDRDPTVFWDPETGQMKDDPAAREAFRQFCEDNPMLVRRLRESKQNQPSAIQITGTNPESGLSLQSPQEIANFLWENRKVPGRFNDAGELLDRLDQFPVLPPAFDAPYVDEPTAATLDLGKDANGYLAARAWNQYAQLPLPTYEDYHDGLPRNYPRAAPTAAEVYPARVPRSPMMIIFQMSPARAQTYHAELMEREGWFDGSGWEVDGGVDRDDDRWFPGTSEPVVVGTLEIGGWAKSAWERALDMWTKQGEEYGLKLDPGLLAQLRSEAKLLMDRGIANEYDITPPMSPEQAKDPELRTAFEAHRTLMYYRQNRQATNFDFFLTEADAESGWDAIEARKHFFLARRAYLDGDRYAALEQYTEGFAKWKSMLETHPHYHRHDRTNSAQEQTLEWALDFVRLSADVFGRGGLRDKVVGMQQATFEMLAAGTRSPLSALGSYGAIEEVRGEPVPSAVPGNPLDGNASDGKPWVSAMTVQEAKELYGVPPDSITQIQGDDAPPGGGPGE